MKQPKLILTIKQKCEECDGTGHKKFFECYKCVGKGQQIIHIYPLRNLEKCDCLIHVKAYDKNRIPIYYEDVSDCKRCDGTGYKIPFKDYEIKKVSEVNCDYCQRGKQCSSATCLKNNLDKHKLKENDEIVLVRR